MNKSLMIIVLACIFAMTVSAQTLSVDYGKVIVPCRMAVEKYESLLAKQAQLVRIQAQHDSLIDAWSSQCYQALADPNLSDYDIRVLLNSTYADIDGEELYASIQARMDSISTSKPTIEEVNTGDAIADVNDRASKEETETASDGKVGKDVKPSMQDIIKSKDNK